jgi:hypothetical protein
MLEFEENDYLLVSDPIRNEYFPVRFVRKNEKGIEAILLCDGLPILLYYYQIFLYGFRNVSITPLLLEKLGFLREGNKTWFLNELCVHECLIRDVQIRDLVYEDNSKHYGFVTTKKNMLHQLQSDFEKFQHKKFDFAKKYTPSFNVNSVIKKMMEENEESFDIEQFDKIILEYCESNT